MQIVCSGKVSRLHDLLFIRGKTFTIVQQFKTPYNKKEKNSLQNLHDWRLIRENCKSFQPQTICIIRYIIVVAMDNMLACAGTDPDIIISKEVADLGFKLIFHIAIISISYHIKLKVGLIEQWLSLYSV